MPLARENTTSVSIGILRCGRFAPLRNSSRRALRALAQNYALLRRRKSKNRGQRPRKKKAEIGPLCPQKTGLARSRQPSSLKSHGSSLAGVGVGGGITRQGERFSFRFVARGHGSNQRFPRAPERRKVRFHGRWEVHSWTTHLPWNCTGLDEKGRPGSLSEPQPGPKKNTLPGESLEAQRDSPTDSPIDPGGAGRDRPFRTSLFHVFIPRR
jgi:hypothetical protein